MRMRFPPRLRVRKRRDFQRAFAEGRRAHDGPLVVWVMPNGLDVTRLGLIVSRKHGGAVRRNRLKRILREAFRLSQHDLPPGYDLLIAPQRGMHMCLEDCILSLVRVTKRMCV